MIKSTLFCSLWSDLSRVSLKMKRRNNPLSISLPLWLVFTFVVSVASANPTDQAGHQPTHFSKIKPHIQSTVDQLQNQAPQAKIKWKTSQLNPTLFLNLNLPLTGRSPLEQAHGFIQTYAGLWPNIEIKIQEINHRKNRTLVALSGSIDQAPILNQNAKLLIKENTLINLSNGLDGVAVFNRAKLKEKEIPALLLNKKIIPPNTQVQVKRGWMVYAGEATEVFECEVALVPLHSQPLYHIHGQTGELIKVSSRTRR